MPDKGKVYLIGAGPGDPGLLTLRGRELLEQAQSVVYDRLVGEDILSMMPEQAEKINVGKNAGHHPVPQERINEILVEKAMEGKRVVRLKGGDSFVFGRGGEELEKLRENGIEFEVVPGITSAIAAAAYAGIPVTHRDFCSSLHLITGHRKGNDSLNLPYQALAQLEGTLIFFMSVSTIGEIAEGLIAGGMDPQMPSALVENGTRPEQRKVVSTLGKIAAEAEEKKVVSPALFLVGKVCALSDRFDWYDRLPLKGKRILITRPAGARNDLAKLLREYGARVTHIPAIRVQEVPFETEGLDRASGLLFTSSSGVAFFFEQLWKIGKDARALYGKKMFCVGRETARTLERYGIRADFVPSSYSGGQLALELVEKKLAGSGDFLLLLRGRQASPGLPAELRKNGIPFEEITVYETLDEELPPLDMEEFDAATFTSASCVRSFAGMLLRHGKKTEGICALCIGEQTAAAAREYGMDVSVSPEATVPSMARWIAGIFENQAKA